MHLHFVLKEKLFFPKFDKKENVRIHLPTNSSMMIISKIHDLRQYIFNDHCMCSVMPSREERRCKVLIIAPYFGL